jgi:ABC-type antimicrobial peptide transport system permease subunit
MNSIQNKNMFASIVSFFIGFVSLAQGSTPPPPMPPPPPGLPIDGGLLILFVVALLFGCYKAYKISRKLS